MEKHRSDILAAARRMHDRFGERALEEVRLRIRELTEHGENEAAEFWRAVAKIIEVLAQKPPRGPRH